VRDGLTNEQIASRLAITADTAKFHVSEILSKLSVETRQQAAAWQGRPRAVPATGIPAAIGRYVGSLTPLQVAGAAVIAAAAIGLAALAAGVLLTGSTPRPSGPTLAPDGRSGNERVDAFIDSLLQDDASALARRFAGVTAREGSWDFGGIYNPRTVPASEWSTRLATATRVLHAVVVDPPEGYRKPGPGGVPLLMTPRDFDVLLLVEEASTTAWRFSLVDGGVIDFVITPVSRTGPPENMRPNFGLRGLMPSPIHEQDRFAVLPPEETWPAPTPYAGSGISEPPPAPVDTPTYAPGGRTGDKALDTIIDALLSDNAAALAGRFGKLAARERVLYTGGEERRVPLAEWAGRLFAAKRSLYSVYTDEVVDARIALAVDSGGAAAENWQFGVDNGRLVEVEIHLLPPGAEAQVDGDRLYYLTHSPPSPAGPPGYYERFYVLPPEDRLPRPPASRPLSARTGDTGVDRLLALLEARDASGLRAAIVPSDDLIVPACGYDEEMLEPAYLDRWAEETARTALQLHAVARVPEGYPWPGQHLIILVSQVNPLWWSTMGIFERQGQIVAIVPLGSCAPGYPPARFLLPPPPIGQAFDESRRPAFPRANPVLDAVYQGDVAALATLIDYPMVECAPPLGLGSPPPCPPGSSPGTPVQALKTGCHGDYSLPAEAPREVIQWLHDAALYAIVESTTQPDALVAIFARRPEISSAGAPPRPFTYGVGAAVIRDGRLVDFRAPGCGIQSVFGWLGSNARPDFLLPPP
jgi:hypothetical protein